MALKYIHDAGGERYVEETQAEIDAIQQAKQAGSARKQARLAERAREDSFVADTSRQEFIDQLKTATPAQIETFVRNKINVDGVTDLATAKQAMKRMETAVVVLLKLLVLTVRA